MSRRLGTSMLLVHGAFMGAWAFQPLVPLLAAHGISTVAIDLPGHGVNASFPESYLARPPDLAAFAVEPSPVAGITLEDNVRSTLAAIDAMQQGGSGPVVLVGHSLAGVTITAVAEQAPEKIAQLIYVAALLPSPGVPALSYVESTENTGDKAIDLLLGDPEKIGALRIDPNGSAPAYVDTIRAAFFNDVAGSRLPALRHLLVPDVPLQPLSTPLRHSAGRWGRVPRVFVRCTDDFVVRPALQDRMIREADAVAPENPTQVVSLASGHTPSLSMPTALADTLARVVT